ncbi:MAG: heavy-metal-associated domain-containing protein [Bdellovibrionales bacterium]
MKAEDSKDQIRGIQRSGSRVKLILDNIKCGGCAKTITKALSDLGLTEVFVDPQSSSVEINSPENSLLLSDAITKLKGLGYPLIDTEEGLEAVALKAKSYLSCAIGKIS